MVNEHTSCVGAHAVSLLYIAFEAATCGDLVVLTVPVRAVPQLSEDNVRVVPLRRTRVHAGTKEVRGSAINNGRVGYNS